VALRFRASSLRSKPDLSRSHGGTEKKEREKGASIVARVVEDEFRLFLCASAPL
jgi:hypothetical protein